MKLYLIRHGETVDNVAGLYAGTRDSLLTNLGVQQTERLGDYFVKNDVKFTHIFTSPLSRAYRTAEAVRKAQSRSTKKEDGSGWRDVEIVKVHGLIERSFGYYEGKPFRARTDPAQNERHRSLPGFVEVESHKSMAKRIDAFLDGQLLPLLDEEEKDAEFVVAIVAHGLLLERFWKRLLLHLSRKGVSVAPEITAARGTVMLESLGGWSNTGYMELSIQKDEEPERKSPSGQDAYPRRSAAPEPKTLPTPGPPPRSAEDAEISIAPTPSEEPAIRSQIPRRLVGWSTTILAVNSTTHLGGLKRQRGGIGSLAHDDGQRKLDSFFKEPRLS